MHDAVLFERAGRPAVVIVTDLFVPTVQATALVAGMPDVRVVTVPHPTSRKSDDELRALADRIAPEILAKLEAEAR